jgi:hypothetical protein
MRAWLTALVITAWATGAQAQIGVPFEPYAPSASYLVLGNKGAECATEPVPAPSTRDVRRGQPSSALDGPSAGSQAETRAASGCPTR